MISLPQIIRIFLAVRREKWRGVGEEGMENRLGNWAVNEGWEIWQGFCLMGFQFKDPESLISKEISGFNEVV